MTDALSVPRTSHITYRGWFVPHVLTRKRLRVVILQLGEYSLVDSDHDI